jgi:hypothetical protein
MKGLSRFLAALHRHRVWGWVALILYACAVTFPHQNVQDIVGQLATKYSHKRLYQVSATIALIEGVALTWLFIRSVSGQIGRRWLAAFWVLSFALMGGTWRLLTANNTELVHFPQYFPEGMALLALTLSPVESMTWLTLFGGLDEAYQYIYLSHGRPVSLDFNDIYMDLVGGAAGIIFAMACLRSEPRTSSGESGRELWKRILSRPGVLVILGILLACVGLWMSGKLLIYEVPGAPSHWFAVSRLKTASFWYFNPITFGPNHFHEMAPVEGMLLILATIALYALLDRKLRIVPKPAIERG